MDSQTSTGFIGTPESGEAVDHRPFPIEIAIFRHIQITMVGLIFHCIPWNPLNIIKPHLLTGNVDVLPPFCVPSIGHPCQSAWGAGQSRKWWAAQAERPGVSEAPRPPRLGRVAKDGSEGLLKDWVYGINHGKSTEKNHHGKSHGKSIYVQNHSTSIRFYNSVLQG